MNIKKYKKYAITVLLYLIISIAFFLIGGNQLKYVNRELKQLETVGVFPEIIKDTKIEQHFSPQMDQITSIKILIATCARENQGNLFLNIIDSTTGVVVAEDKVDVSSLKDNAEFEWKFDNPLKVEKEKEYILSISTDGQPGNAITLYYGPENLGHFSALTVNGESFPADLYIMVTGITYSIFGLHYWFWVLLFGIAIITYLIWSDHNAKKGKITRGLLVIIIWKKYKFLIQQLVSRDFKIKYKRSVLGYCWSFLNPLLTMVVQYIVFSTIFRSGVDNYPVYLLSGIILFGFFTDAVGQGLMSIVSNASLITKVYVPKYIYPISKVASSSINLFISFIPLLLVVLLTGQKVTIAILLIPFVLICLLVFCMGMTLMLSSAMVFFRDTQYLWGIVSMIWMYATPLFYPESIIPDKFRIIQTMNPMYYMVKFLRIILIDGVSPEPMLYFKCIVGAFITCFIGALIFKRSQNKFVLYI